MSSRFPNGTEIRNIDGLLDHCFVRGVEDSIERNVFKHFLHSKFVRIKDHNGIDLVCFSNRSPVLLFVWGDVEVMGYDNVDVS